MDEIIQRKTIDNLITEYHKIVNNIIKAYDYMESAESIYKESFRDPYFRATPQEHASRARELVLNDLKVTTWRRFIELLGIRKILSIAKRKDLDSNLSDPDALPEINIENVYDMLKTFVDNSDEFIKESCIEVFNFLRPYHFKRKYRTNKRWFIDKKVILERALDDNAFGYKYYRVSHWHRDRLSVLERVMHALDGKGIPSGYYSPLEDAIEKTAIDDGIGETEYYKFKCYKNGNLHLEFKRPDLVKELNKLGGDGSSLPG
jgi:hypothetical protein